MRRRRVTSKENEENLVETELHKAIASGDLKSLSEAIKSDAEALNMRNPDKKTPLDLAIYLSNITAAELLIASGADLNICNREGLTPLHQLIKSVDSLIEKEVQGESIVALAKDLIAKGADLVAQDRRGNTLINFVSQKAKANKPATKTYTKIGKLLLDSDANAAETIAIKNNMGKTPMDYLSRNGNATLRDVVYHCETDRRASKEALKAISGLSSQQREKA